jgi:integrase
MPLKIIPPRKGWSPYYRVRGTYLGNYVNRSTKTSNQATANKLLQKWQREIEAGEFTTKDEPTFAEAALSYMQAGGDRRPLAPLLRHFGNTRLRYIDQAVIDNAAHTLFPNATPATRNREVYTPVSAVLKHNGIEKKIRRPKGWRGKRSTSWLEPDQALRLFLAADNINPEFGLFLRVLCYTGMRLSEALGVRLSQVNLSEQMIYLPETKNDDPRAVHLPPVLIETLPKHPRGLNRDPDERLFRFHASGRLREMLNMAKQAAGVSFPYRQGGFHLFRHTYGTWMHHYGNLDTYKLVETKVWRDPSSAARYAHTKPNAAARRADFLPGAVNGLGNPEQSLPEPQNSP